MQAIDGSLKRLQLDFVDLVYCHRSDPLTPIEETVFAMSDMITQGKALYWGTSEWSAADIKSAYEIADKYRLHKPVMEQPQYNLFHRKRVEQEYAPLYDSMKLGLTTWSPLASGLLTGKYQSGVPKDSRGAMQNMSFLLPSLTDPVKNETVAKLSSLAKELGGNVAQLSIAWALKNDQVSSVILGASNISQLQDNLGATAIKEKLTPEVLKSIDQITQSIEIT
jgi:aryl-alcohol dehydrogenase-like predicted oxidoreductase